MQRFPISSYFRREAFAAPSTASSFETELSSLSGVKYILDMIFCNNNEYICTSNNLSKTTNIEEISFIYLYNLNDFFNSHLSATKPISVSEVFLPDFSLHGPKAKTIPKM